MNKAYMNLVAGGIEAAKKHIPEVRPKYQTTTILKKVANGMTFLCVPLGERENYAVKHGFKLRTLQRHTQQYKEGRFDRPNIHITRNVIENPREGRYDQYFPLLKTVVDEIREKPGQWLTKSDLRVLISRVATGVECTVDALWFSDEARSISLTGIIDDEVSKVSYDTVNRFLRMSELALRAVNNTVVKMSPSADLQQMAFQHQLLTAPSKYDPRLIINADELKLRLKVAPRHCINDKKKDKNRVEPYYRECPSTGMIAVALSGDIVTPTIIMDGVDRPVMFHNPADSSFEYKCGSKRSHSQATGNDDEPVIMDLDTGEEIVVGAPASHDGVPAPDPASTLPSVLNSSGEQEGVLLIEEAEAKGGSSGRRSEEDYIDDVIRSERAGFQKLIKRAQLVMRPSPSEEALAEVHRLEDAASDEFAAELRRAIAKKKEGIDDERAKLVKEKKCELTKLKSSAHSSRQDHALSDETKELTEVKMSDEHAMQPAEGKIPSDSLKADIKRCEAEIKRLSAALTRSARLCKKDIEALGRNILNTGDFEERRERHAGAVAAILSTDAKSLRSLGEHHHDLTSKRFASIEGKEGQVELKEDLTDVIQRRSHMKVASYEMAGHFSTGKWMCRWAEDVLDDYRRSLGLANRRMLLIIDGCRVHQVQEFQDVCDRLSIDVLYVPHNQTSHLQVLDVAAFGAFRTVFTRFIRNRMLETSIMGHAIKNNAQTDLIDGLHYCAASIKPATIIHGFHLVAMRSDLIPGAKDHRVPYNPQRLVK